MTLSTEVDTGEVEDLESFRQRARAWMLVFSSALMM